jgi:hypothetical protein
MHNIPVELQRRFERRWAARFPRPSINKLNPNRRKAADLFKRDTGKNGAAPTKMRVASDASPRASNVHAVNLLHVNRTNCVGLSRNRHGCNSERLVVTAHVAVGLNPDFLRRVSELSS